MGPAETQLELGYNPIGPDGAKSLCEVIKFHGKLETLKLGWCQIGPKGAEYIADALKYNTTISTLDLLANGLEDDGAVCLARSLRIANEALTSLDLGFNEIRDNGAFALAQALKANEDIAVTSLNLANNFLTKYGQVALTTRPKGGARQIDSMTKNMSVVWSLRLLDDTSYMQTGGNFWSLPVISALFLLQPTYIKLAFRILSVGDTQMFYNLFYWLEIIYVKFHVHINLLDACLSLLHGT